MKKKISNLFSLALSLVLTLSLAVPAFAYEDTDPPQWEQLGYSSLEEMLTDCGMTEEEYYDLAAYYVEEEKSQQEWEAACLEWLAAHPEEAAAFDQNAYFEDSYFWYDSPEEYMEAYGITELEFRQQMLNYWAGEQMEQEKFQNELDAFIADHPKEYAAFDPYIYFAQEYSWYASPEEYMKGMDMTQEEFRREMLSSWMYDFQYMEQQKALYGGMADGLNVMVNGVCIPFPDARPEITNDRTMVPLAAAMEHLGAEVSYDQATHTAVVSMDGFSFSHAIGTNVLDLPDGSTFTMDTASYVKEGRTMVPIAFFAQYLGYEVYWDADYYTAVLLDREEAVALIDEQFTLFNRILYTLSGADQRKEGQSLKTTCDMEMVLTVLDSLHGDKTYSMSMDSISLANESAVQDTYTMDLTDLMDLILDMTGSYSDPEELAELEAYRPLLADLTFDIRMDLEGEYLYLHSPLFAELELVEDPDTWVAVSLYGLNEAANLAPDELTLGNLLVTLEAADPTDAFHLWNNITGPAAQLAEYVGDDCFTKSGSSYVVEWDLMEGSYYAYKDETFTVQLKITPSGSRSCTYSLTMDAAADGAALDILLSGSSGKINMDMDLHIKNMLKATLELTCRITSTTQKPQPQPPAGSKIEYINDFGDAVLGW